MNWIQKRSTWLAFISSVALVLICIRTGSLASPQTAIVDGTAHLLSVARPALPTQRPQQSAAITASAATVVTIPLYNEGVYANLEIANAAGGATVTIVIQARDHADGEWYTLLSGTDFANASDTMPFCSSALAAGTLATDTKAHIHLNLRAAESLRIRATGSASPSSTVTVRGGVRGSSASM